MKFMIWQNKSFRLAVILTLVYFGTGLILLYWNFSDLNDFLFYGLPTLLGISLGLLPDRRKAILGGLVGLLGCIIIMLIIQYEGLFCIILALPIILVSFLLGIFLSRWIPRKSSEITKEKLHVLLLPLLFYIGGSLYQNFYSASEPSYEIVTSERNYTNTPLEVYNAIKSLDTLAGQKPWMMRLGLPVPLKCELEEEIVGGIRTCRFVEGSIVERITEIDPGRILKMDIISSDVMLNNWQTFITAEYLFKPIQNNSCRLIRTTTYSSIVRPRFYWSTLEKFGITQEHKYVLDNLERNLAANSAN